MTAPTAERADAATAGGAAGPGRRGGGVDVVLIAGLLLIVALAGVLRAPNLLAGVPDALHPDEGTVINRGVTALQGEVAPPAFDWPPASSYLYAGAAAATRTVIPDVVEDRRLRFSLGRVLFLGVALLTVLATGLLASRLGSTVRQRRIAGWTAASALAASYLSIRLSRLSHPEHLQLLFMLLSAGAALRFDRTRSRGMLAAAGVLAGLAGATKYLGVGVGLIALLAVVTSAEAWPRRRAGSRARTLLDLVVLPVGALVGFVAGTLGTALTAEHFLEGFLWQLGHQAGGHLGYEAGRLPGWVFHAVTSFPGDWGWPMTIVAFAAAGWVVVRGTRHERLVAAFVLTLYVLIGASQIRFPHYILVTTPFFAALAGSRVARLRPPRVQLLVIAVLAASLALAALNGVRLTRVAAAPLTQTVADATVADLPEPVWKEAYTSTVPVEREVWSFGDTPEVLDCGCHVVISSFQEERFRGRPDLYAEEIAVYDEIRARGEVVATAAPTVPLTYRWDLLPQWGMGEVPLTGPVPRVGPTIDVIDLTGG